MSIATFSFVKPERSYVICTSPRSGSWLLSEGLQATKIAGRPREWLHKVAEENCSKEAGLPLPSEVGYTDYLDYMIRMATTPNGVFGLKCHWYQLESLPAKLATIEGFEHLSLPVTLARLFPKLNFIWLTRKNKIRQAVSLDRARQSGAWWHEESFPQKPPTLGHESFDPAMINRAERQLLANEIGWQDFFKGCNATPLRIVYEDLIDNYEATIRRTLQFLELPHWDTIPIAPPRVKQQSDKTSEDWVANYLTFQKNRTNAPVSQRVMPARARMRPAECRRLINQGKLLGLTDPVIVQMLVVQNVPRDVAEKEVRRAANKPLLQVGQEMVQRLQHAERALERLATLRKQASGHNALPTRDQITAAEFRDQFYFANRPLLFTTAETSGVDAARWSPEALCVLAPDQVVDAIRSGPTDAQQGDRPLERVQLPFPDFVVQLDTTTEFQKLSFAARHTFFKPLEGVSLFDGLSPLATVLDASQSREGSTLYLEPNGGRTLLRYETMNLVLMQLHGRRRIRLIPAVESALVPPGPQHASGIDPWNPNYEWAPGYRDVTVIEHELQPGEALFLPVGWWHAEELHGTNVMLAFTNFFLPNPSAPPEQN